MVRTSNHPGSHASSTLSTVSPNARARCAAARAGAWSAVGRRALAFPFRAGRGAFGRLARPGAWRGRPEARQVPSARYGQVFVNARSPTNENFYSRKFLSFRQAGVACTGNHRRMLMSQDEDLVAAIADFRRQLPGWWFTIGECSVSCDATVGPDRARISEPFLSLFDAGFDGDLLQPSTMAAALRGATAQAVEALRQLGPV